MKTEKTKNKASQRIDQNNEMKKKTKRSKKIKNALTNFEVFQQNVRGLKSKVDYIMETISDYQPILICLVETHLQKEEIRIPGYCQIFRNDRSGNSGGIMLALKENIRTVTLEVAQEKEIGQSLWILLDNNRSKIRIGVTCAPQENVTSNNELKIMYNNISKQISITQEERLQVLILGDFNAKVGTYIEGNKPTMTKGGRQLMKMTKKI